MKRWKKMIHNCPYLIALLSIWLLLTIGGAVLMIYRDYGGMEWSSFWANPFFAVVIEEEMHESVGRTARAETVMAHAAPQEQSVILANNGEIADVTENSGLYLLAAVELGKEQITNGNIEIGQIEENARTETSGDGEENTDAEVEAEEEKTEIAGKTYFELYPPVETNSIYFKDAGKIALTTEYPYTTVTEDYFTDAAFLGDSRTMGIADYAGLDADFYCENGMTIYKLLGEKGVTYQKTGEKVNLCNVLQQKKYGKIYIMLGMNELGYRDTEYFQEQYHAVLEQIRQWQPQAIIFIMANLHVSQAKNNIQTEFNNININSKNAAAATFADGIDVFYLDSNPLFTDSDGLLKEDLTFDGVHLYANNYAEWKNFLMEHGVVRGNEGDSISAGNEEDQTE